MLDEILCQGIVRKLQIGGDSGTDHDISIPVGIEVRFRWIFITFSPEVGLRLDCLFQHRFLRLW